MTEFIRQPEEPEGKQTLEDELDAIIDAQNAKKCLPAESAADQSDLLKIQQTFEDELFRTF